MVDVTPRFKEPRVKAPPKPLKRTRMKPTKTRLAPFSQRRAAQADERRAVVAAVVARDGGCVPKMRGAPGDCDVWRNGLTAHEVVKRSQLRDAHLDESNCVASCWLHNQWVEDNPTAAKALGLVVSRGAL